VEDFLPVVPLACDFEIAYAPRRRNGERLANARVGAE